MSEFFSPVLCSDGRNRNSLKKQSIFFSFKESFISNYSHCKVDHNDPENEDYNARNANAYAITKHLSACLMMQLFRS